MLWRSFVSVLEKLWFFRRILTKLSQMLIKIEKNND